MKTDLFQSHGHCWIFQICWHIAGSTFTTSSFRIWNSSAVIPSPPLTLFVVMLRPTWLHIPGCLVLGDWSHHCIKYFSTSLQLSYVHFWKIIRIPLSAYSLQFLESFVFLIQTILTDVRLFLIEVLICIYLVINVELLLIHRSAINMSFFWKMSIQVFSPFSNLIICLFVIDL